MQIQAGTPAPLFQASDLDGHSIDLAAYAGQPVLLAFFRNAACALCNLRVRHLINAYPEYQRRGLAIIAVFESPRERMQEYLGRQAAPFPLIADPQAALYELYGVESSAAKIEQSMAMAETHASVQAAADHGFALIAEEGSNFNRLPAEFLIGPDGSIQLAHYAAHVTDHLDLEKIAAHLELNAAI
jgi:thioredoxin-dependent peroxiredoxin